MLETFHWLPGQGFGLIVEDLLRLPADTGAIAGLLAITYKLSPAYPDGLKSHARQGSRLAHPTFQLAVATTQLSEPPCSVRSGSSPRFRKTRE
ncbi:hypothetical protein GCM10009736_38380 [Actinomadura bangladeshensis]